jgi:hypothetical protein
MVRKTHKLIEHSCKKREKKCYVNEKKERNRISDNGYTDVENIYIY